MYCTLNCKSRKLTYLHTNQRSQDISQQRETNRKHNIQSCIVFIFTPFPVEYMSSSNLHHADVFGDDSDSAFLFADRKLRRLPLYPHLMPLFSSLLLFQFLIFSFFFGGLRFYLINQPQMLPMATNCNYQYKNSATINFDNLKRSTPNKPIWKRLG